jgi:alkylation response protein AidB-like acyl-CoA dehydrogenase
MIYRAPIAEQHFVLDSIADIGGLSDLPAFEAVSAAVVESILLESAKLAEEVLAPLNRIGDAQGASFSENTVTLPAGFVEAYRKYAAGGWASLGGDPAHGGQGLPFALGCAVQEQLTSANMAFAVCMTLTQGAIEALSAHGSKEQKELYLTRLINGDWTGTMNLTEPQAGSDVGALRTKAERRPDGSYHITGSKIFITWGEHDAAENIIHLVLARVPGAPEGTRGISLFLVPKCLDGGARNDVRCESIEHKLGIHASPTCTMSFGENGQCIGYLVGAENGGMRAMFTMMNHARIGVGLQGVAVAERAYQGALAYARERVQGKRIVEHADVRRMLMTMKATTEAIRALVYFTAAALDRAHADADPEKGREAQLLADLLTPIAKAYATDMGVEMASLAIQVFGGVGYIEETGIAQHLRDSRIAPIYEGTNGIQALDLVSRKLPQGHWRRLLAEIDYFVSSLPDGEDIGHMRLHLADAVGSLKYASEWLAGKQSSDDIAAGATPYLRLFGTVVCAWLLTKQAVIARAQLNAGKGDTRFLNAKIAIARFFAEQMLPPAAALRGPITCGAGMLYALSEEQLAADSRQH